MQISELARQAGLPLSAVKYYQREGMLPGGARSAAPNRIDYDEVHVQRLRLIRALLETGGLPVAAARAVLASLDEARPLAETFETAQHAMSGPRGAETAPSDGSRRRVVAAARARGWAFTEDNPGVDAAARALDGFDAIGFEASAEYLDAYAQAAALVAAADVRALLSRPDPDRIAELMVVGTVLGDPLMAGLRRVAHEDATHELFPVDADGAGA